jgi:hypothetical protein
MKALQVREKKLFYLLGGAVLVGLHLIFLQLALRFDRGNRLELAEVQAKLEEARMWVGEKEAWEGRAAWLDQHLKPWLADSPEGALQQFAQSTARQANLAIEGQTLRAQRPGNQVVTVANRMLMKGSLEQILRWLGSVYDPMKGVAVTELSLKLSPEPPKMTVQAEVAQFFKKGNP